jgi:hypothetical protein
VLDVGRRDLVLRRMTVDGRGTVSLSGRALPFTCHLQLTLRDFGVPVTIWPPR